MVNRFLLPKRISLDSLALRDTRFEGYYKGKSLKRLADMAIVNSDLSASIRFYRGPESSMYLDIDFAVDLLVACQRCLEPMPLQASGSTTVGLIEIQSIDDLDEKSRLSQWLLNSEGELPLKRYLEDEVMLSLPLAPRHEEGVCSVGEEFRPEEEGNGGRNHFSDLKSLMKYRKGEVH